MRRLAIFSLLAVGCGVDPAQTAPGPGPTVKVTLDGGLLQNVVLTGEVVDLADLLPPALALGEVRQIVATAHEDTHLGVRNPTIRHPGAHFVLDLDSDRRPTFMISPAVVDGLSPDTQAARLASAPRLVGVHTVSVYVSPRAPAVAETVGQPLRMRIEGVGALDLSAAQLAARPKVADPRGRTDGWSLATLVASRAPGRDIAELWVVPGDGDPILLPPPSATMLHIVKYNQTGELRLQTWNRSEDQPRPSQVHKDIGLLRVVLAQ